MCTANKQALPFGATCGVLNRLNTNATPIHSFPVDGIFSMSSEMKNGYQEEKKGERNYAKRRIDVSLCLYVYYTRFLLLEKDKKLTVSR